MFRASSSVSPAFLGHSWSFLLLSWVTRLLLGVAPGSLLVAPGSLGDSCVVPELHWVSVILARPAGQQQTRRASVLGS